MADLERIARACSNQVLVVDTSWRWRTDHPNLSASHLTHALGVHGLSAHDLPIPIFPTATPATGAVTSLDALQLLPFGTYGDILLGLGHEAGVIRHRGKVILVDERIGGILGTEDDILERSSTYEQIRRGLSEALQLLAVCETAAEQLASCGWPACEVVSSPDDVVRLVAGVLW